jgi:hypothetical protein
LSDVQASSPLRLPLRRSSWSSPGCGAGGARNVQAEKGAPSLTAISIRAAAPYADVVRGCDRHHTGVGYGGVPEEALRQSLCVGPVALGSLGVLKRSQLRPSDRGQRRFLAIESIAVVDAGAQVDIYVAGRRYRRPGLAGC